MEVPKRTYRIAVLAIYVPLILTVFVSFGTDIRLYSPAAMEVAEYWMRAIKLIMVLFGLGLFTFCHHSVANAISTKVTGTVRRNFNIVSTHILGWIQIPLLILGLIFFYPKASVPENFHAENVVGENTVYVYSHAYGSFFTPRKQFYLKCSLPFHRYKQIYIGKALWMTELTVDIVDGELVAKGITDREPVEHRFPLPEPGCQN